MGIRFVAALLAPLALTACGFTPLYSTQGETGVAREIRDIHLAQLTGPPDASHFVQSALAVSLPGDKGENSRYTLTIRLRDQRRAIAVTRSADTTRFDYFLNATYELTDMVTGEKRRQRLDTVVSYGVVDSQYASLVGREDAVRRAALEIARKVELDIALYLKGRAPNPNEMRSAPDIGTGYELDPFGNDKPNDDEKKDEDVLQQ